MLVNICKYSIHGAYGFEQHPILRKSGACFFPDERSAWASVGVGKDYTSHVLGDQLGNCKALHTKRLQARKVSNAERSMSCHHDAAFLGTAMVI